MQVESVFTVLNKRVNSFVNDSFETSLKLFVHNYVKLGNSATSPRVERVCVLYNRLLPFISAQSNVNLMNTLVSQCCTRFIKIARFFFFFFKKKACLGLNYLFPDNRAC